MSIIFLVKPNPTTLAELMLQDEIAEVMASEVVSTARELASRKIDGTNMNPSAPGQPPAVQTGNLFRSIRSVPGVGSVEREVEAGAEYAGFLEYGTSRMAPRPFMEPAIREVRAREREIADRVLAAHGTIVPPGVAAPTTLQEVFGGPSVQMV